MVFFQVTTVTSAGVNSAGRNALVTSLMVCCGFVVCWTPSETIYFLVNFVGYNIDFGGWFYHLICFLDSPFERLSFYQANRF